MDPYERLFQDDEFGLIFEPFEILEPFDLYRISDLIWIWLCLSLGELYQLYLYKSVYSSSFYLSINLCLLLLIRIYYVTNLKHIFVIYIIHLLSFLSYIICMLYVYIQEDSLSYLFYYCSLYIIIVNITTLIIVKIFIKGNKMNMYKSEGHKCPIEIEKCQICPCIICIESVDHLIKLNCGHQIHTSCFLKWIETKDRHICPYCRCVLNTVN
jgi:hypothetical protein